ncbi:MAG TPA: phosphomannomutase/phosphoglucomutase [Methylomirabilota bacterium]|jgi:phosphomannomutase/phosphoglucomutase|nr:phosphomannomutase/phosphoglucomutase [Methylomirabilota bacterium]
MTVNPFIFRAYDVRGKVGIDLTPEVFELIGRAYGTLVRQKGGRTIALGMDNRTTSPPLERGFGAGVLSTGVDVVDIGVNHTPLLYFATAHWRLDGGATVTGSHNPVSDNGVKMVHAGAAPLTEGEIQGLLDTIRRRDFARGAGSMTRRDPREDYFGAITGSVKIARPLKVVVDAGNGVAGSFAPELLRRLGCEVIELFCESDGTFPNHLPDPEMEENIQDLIAKVLEARADIGIAYDGDADRMGVVDERGRRHEADLILALLARDLLTRHPGAKIVFDVKSSQALIEDVRAHGGRPIMWKTGHSHLKQKMREDGILLGGEVSGHMFFAENWYGVDDGILASCKFLELCSRSPRAVSSHFDTLPHLHNTPELKAPCPDDRKFEVVDELVREFKGRYETIDIDGARILFPDGWGLVRASNTNPYLTLRFEGRSPEAVEEMKRVVFDALRRYPFVTLPS